MKDMGLDIDRALRRRLNWGKGGETKGQNFSESSIVDEIDSRFTSLKKKISYRDRVIAQSRETISNHEATIATKDATIAIKEERIKAQLPLEMIRKAIEQSSVVGADESGTKVDGKNHWMWTFQTDMASYLAIDKSHAGKVVNDHFPDGFPDSTLVSDRLALYFNVVARDHQICLAHLLRNTIIGVR